MPIIEVGRVCVKLSGREAGQKCVIVDVIDKNFVLITGPRKISGVRRRRTNVKHLEPTEDTIDIKKGASDEDISKAIGRGKKAERKMLVKLDEETDPSYGCPPLKRPIDQHVRFGLINLDKPSGPSSHEVVAWVKRMLGLKHAGHGGTLETRPRSEQSNGHRRTAPGTRRGHEDDPGIPPDRQRIHLHHDSTRRR